jgi:hypothetical protein
MAIPRASLASWSGIELVQPMAGGARNEVLLAERGGHRLVVRRSSRSPSALEWELNLLEYLREHRIGVPELVPSDDGCRQVDDVRLAMAGSDAAAGLDPKNIQPIEPQTL